ncbi:aminoglycoside phosphotransferase family protein [Methylobacterium sp. J-092]|uniref:aminoglycoside phosphotransferase family protein n=1 Tax=Methylobacterium sp. J-092 TaxID=2836667 RepID=UPI001FB8EF99|nr:aminoglycoside phosphotransferase family protein [Methylobacterium sp. J-092]MCJ2006268.1 aminoglycoside phosphotransferase family protein [Methylobacterium sp. J-092]
MASLQLITSAAYVNQELVAEFGQIPPAFLPMGTARLYEMQVAHLKSSDLIHLTIPASFQPQPHDMTRLKALGILLVPVPDELCLGESIVYALNYVGAPHGPVTILHGDTLIEDVPAEAVDAIASHGEGDDYSWAAIDLEDGGVIGLEVIAPGTGHEEGRPIACGYFTLGSTTLLIRSITRARGDFIKGLNLYAQERSLRAVPVTRWRDFGHIQSYFRSRRQINTARNFNTVQIGPRIVRKTSRDGEKMTAEASWFRNLPPEIQPYSARFLGDGQDENGLFYNTEYQYAPTLSELFVFSSIGRPTWRNILQSCQEFLDACAGRSGPGSGDAALAELAVDKTLARLERYARETGFDIDRPTRLDGRPLPSLLRIVEETVALIDLRSGRPETVMHGDFCFSNILYNSRAGRISVIDPRGYVRQGVPSQFGDLRYDLAKLSHSIAGCYDHIIAGRYNLRQDDTYSFEILFETNTHHAWLQRALAELRVGSVVSSSSEVRALTTGLFLSMLPLHADRPERQRAFIASSLRLYSELDKAAL